MKIDIKDIQGLKPGHSYVFIISPDANMKVACAAIQDFATKGMFNAMVVEDGGLIDIKGDPEHEPEEHDQETDT